jgi:hypothetical protein
LKGFSLDAGAQNWPYWALTYHHGFIRRGLAGAILQGVASGLTVDQQHALVGRIHVAVLLLFAAGIAAWSLLLMRRASGRERRLVLTSVAAIFLSSLVPTEEMTTEYLDIYILAIALGTAFLAFTRRNVVSGLVASIGPFVHDAFLFLWLPVLALAAAEVVASRERRRMALRLAPLALPILAEAVVLRFHSSRALALALAELPASWRGIQLFELPLDFMTSRMRDVYRNDGGNAVLGALLYGWPAVVVAACATALAPGRLRFRLLSSLLITFSPWAILLVAWDLSRFLVWSSFGGFIALCWSMRARRERALADPAPSLSRRSTWALRAALAVLALMALGGPGTYSYFDYTFAEYKVGPDLLRHTPAASIAYAWIGLYNRKFLKRELHPSAGPCELEGTNIHLDDHCVAVMDPKARLAPRFFVLASGAYTARLDVAPVEGCADATGELAVRLRWRLSSPKPSVRFDARVQPSVALDFTIDAEEQAMGAMTVDVTTDQGCLRVSRMAIDRRPE